MNSTNSLEVRTAEEDLLTNGNSRSDICFESLYVGEPVKDTIGLNGTPGLWTLGVHISSVSFLQYCESSGTGVPVIHPSFSVPVMWSLPCAPELARDLSSTCGMCWYRLTSPVVFVCIISINHNSGTAFVWGKAEGTSESCLYRGQ